MKTSPGISVITPIYTAWDHMKRMLFEPFNFTKWLVIGFSCFLANLSSYFSGNGGGGDFSDVSTETTTASINTSSDPFIPALESAFGEFPDWCSGLASFSSCCW